MKLRHKIVAGAAATALTVIAGIAAAGPASATQYLTAQYCGSIGGQYNAYSDLGLQKAGTYHYTGPLCGWYGVNTHYIVTTTGASYFMGWQQNATDIAQYPGWPVDYAYHQTQQSAQITTR
ncbi:MAG TPA: hypothetical protein VIH37_03675 [Candidatus Limnocylindrales bacterium]